MNTHKGMIMQTENGNVAHVLADPNMSKETETAIAKMIDLAHNLIFRTMTRYEAKQAINEGQKVTHTYFTDEEFIGRSQENGQLIDENGIALNESDFWSLRAGASFDNGWSIVD